MSYGHMKQQYQNMCGMSLNPNHFYELKDLHIFFNICMLQFE